MRASAHVGASPTVANSDKARHVPDEIILGDPRVSRTDRSLGRPFWREKSFYGGAIGDILTSKIPRPCLKLG